MLGRLLDRLTSLLLRRPRSVLAVALVIVAASAAIATRLRLDPDVLNLIPRGNREINEFRTLLKETGTLDFHVIVVQFPQGSEPAAYYPLLDRIGEELAKSKRIENVTWRLPDAFAVIDRIIPYSMLILTPQQLDAAAQKLTDQGIRESVARNFTLLQTPQSTVAKQLVRIDPFNLLPIYIEKLQRAGGGLNIDFASGYYVSADQRAAIIIARPHRAAQDLPFSRAVMEETSVITARALSEFGAANKDVPAPTIGYTGGYAIAATDEKIIQRDMFINSITSMIGVLLLYLYAYRRPSAMLYAGLAMASAIIITFALGALTYGTLSAASTGFAALLAGLGLDFMTVLYERYVDERNRGAHVADAVRTLMRHTLPGVIVGALTTAATFYAFLATEFRGMRELGFLTGSGILVFLLCVMFIFPAVLIIVERRRGEKRRLRVHALGSSRLVRASLARPKAVIVFWIAVVIITGIAARNVRFNDSLQGLRATGNEAVRMQEEVTQRFGQSFDAMMYGVRGATAGEAIGKTAAAIPDFERLTNDKIIGSYQSITTFVPPETQQRVVIDTLRRGEGGAFSFARIERTFRDALTEQGFRAEAYDDVLPLYAQAFAQREPLAIETLQRIGLGDAVQRFLKKTEGGFMSVVYVYPTTGKWPRFLPEELQEFRRRHPEGVLTGVNLVSETLRTITRSDATRASLLGLVLVFALVWIGFRSFARACFVFVPFIAGCTCMLGFMATLGLEFNFMNVFVGLMLVGTATDYAVYMLQRYDESPEEFGENALETGRAVTLAALMSIIGFASFAISHYPGMRSIGLASVVGIALSCLASITLLPALLATGYFRHDKASMLGEAEPEPASPTTIAPR
ncbi:MAG TPA: MMPL family transporter [Thermoanaerobaculia bacterium]|nr:MMPL family transporter [Thermoanaerobaculia bacterium]